MAVGKRLKERIKKALACAGRKGLSLRELESHLGVEESRLEAALDELIASGEVQRWRGRYRLAVVAGPGTVEPPVAVAGPGTVEPPVVVEPPPIKVALLVAEAKIPPTTGEVAEAVKLDSRKVYGICRRFEKDGYFERGELRPSPKRVFFVPMLGTNMTRANYGLADRGYRQLRKVVGGFDLNDPRLEQNVRKFFADMLRKKEYAKYRRAIASFREQLLRGIRGAETKSEVYELLGFKPYHPPVPTWKSAVKSGR